MKKIALLLAMALLVTACAAQRPASDPLSDSVPDEQEEDRDVLEDDAQQAGSEEYENNSEEKTFQLYSPGQEKIADIKIPAFLKYVECGKNDIRAKDDIAYDVTYTFYEGWTADDYFENCIKNDEDLTGVNESDPQPVTVGGLNAVYKVLTGLYADSITLTEYFCAVETENGILGITVWAVESEDVEETFLSIIDGISFM